jgi:competence protein ComEC
VSAFAIFLLGYAISSRLFPGDRPQIPGSQQYYSSTIIADPVVTAHAVKIVQQVRCISDTGHHEMPVFKVITFFQKQDTALLNLAIGDKLLFYGQLKDPPPPMNPYEFDYANYLKLNGIRKTAFIRNGDWIYLGYFGEKPVRRKASKVRSHFLDLLKNAGFQGESFAVISAILLGYDDMLEDGLRQDFVNAGAMHILCVSGLHVGVIYLVVNFLLSFLGRQRWQRMLKLVILLSVIWSYAMITGLSPSIRRASVMISMFILGNTFGKGRDSYNTLAASAVMLLVMDPMILFNAGFQLSYAAVLGILTFHQPMYKLFQFKHALADKTWSLFVLSIAAQLGTFPIALHYFHFFPTYFWVTNLVVFPISFLIITGGFLFLVFSWIPYISAFLGLLLIHAVDLLNFSVGFVENLPGHGIEDVYYPILLVPAAYGLVCLVYRLIYRKQILLLKYSLLLILFIVFYNAWREYRVFNQKRVVVYAVRNHTVIDFINGKQCISIQDTAIIHDKKAFNFHVKNARVSWSISDIEQIHPMLFEDATSAFHLHHFFGDNYLILIDELPLKPMDDRKIGIDFAIITGRKPIRLDELLKTFEIRTIVTDGSVPYWKRNNIQVQAEELAIDIHDISISGAFIKEY